MIERIRFEDVQVGDVVRDRDILMVVVEVRWGDRPHELNLRGLRYAVRSHEVLIYGLARTEISRYSTLSRYVRFPARDLLPHDLYVHAGEMRLHIPDDPSTPSFGEDAWVVLVRRGYLIANDYTDSVARDPREWSRNEYNRRNPDDV
jgi:hypothetical protein